MNATDRERDDFDGDTDPSETLHLSVDGQTADCSREEMPSIVLSRANLLAQAGVPSHAVKRILDGHYDLWDEETVFWEDRFPEKGKRIMQLLRPIYASPSGLTSVPSDTTLTYMVRKGFSPAPPGPLPRPRVINLVKPSQFKDMRITPKWMDECLEFAGKASLIDEAFPWAPVESKLRASGFFEFAVYGSALSGELRERLWRSFTNTLRSLWMHLDEVATSPLIADPWAIRDMWTLGNCLPIGFSGSTDAFIFLLCR